MSMENGFELDFPGEPDAVSNDEMPAPLVTLEATLEKAKVLDTVRYWYLVESENGRQWKHWYKGENAADAMAAYTAAILDGNEYVMLESLRMPNGPNQG